MTPPRFVVVVAATLAAGVLACAPGTEPQPGESEAPSQPQLAFVTNGATAFWEIAAAGAKAAGEDFDVSVDVEMPTEGIAHQNKILRDLVAADVDGIAVSPLDPSGQLQMLNEVASKIPLVTHDSDAPESRRLCFVGVDNYEAGRFLGRFLKEVLPEGGNVAILVGSLEQLNAQQRRQGLIDELLDRPVLEEKRVFDRYFPTQQYSKGRPIVGDRFTIVGTYTDGRDFALAETRAGEVLAEHPDLDGLVGLFSYNIPIALRVVEQYGRLGDLEIIAFDEDAETLQGIEDGYVAGTVVQNPYRYGYESIRILAALVSGDRSVLPEGGFLDVSARRVSLENLAAFRAELRELTGQD